MGGGHEGSPRVTRRSVLGGMTAGAIAAHFDTARPTVSRHLQILTECKLLKQAPRGREVHYQLNPKKMKAIADFVEPFRALWEERFDKLEAVMKQYRTKKA